MGQAELLVQSRRRPRSSVRPGARARHPAAAELIGERQPDHRVAQFFVRTCTGPGHPVDRKLVEVAGLPE